MKRVVAWVTLWVMLFIPALSLGGGEYEAKTFDLGGPMDRVKLRERPSTDGRVLGQYFANVIVRVLDHQGTWSRVRIGSREGYMMSKFLTMEINDFDRTTNGLPGFVRYPNAQNILPLYEAPSASAAVRKEMPAGYVRVLGTIDDDWLHILYTEDSGEETYGYASSRDITNTDNFATVVVDTGDPAQKQNMRAAPSRDAAVVGQFFPGTALYYMFDDHTNDDGWERLRVGSTMGYVLTESLDFSSGGLPRFKPPLSEALTTSTPLYDTATAAEASGSMGPNVAFSVLGIQGDRYLVRIETPERYVYQYRYVDKAAVQSVTRSATVAATLKEEQVIYNIDENGQHVPTEFIVPAGTRVMIWGSASEDGAHETAHYIDPSMPWLRCDIEMETSTYVGGLIRREAVQYDTLLEYLPSHLQG